MNEYETIFQLRGKTYHDAMQLYPQVRAEEFLQVLERCPSLAGASVLDVPAGGGYLQAYLPATTHYTLFEPSHGFSHHEAGASHDRLTALPFESGHFDAVLSLAGVHHLTDKLGFYREVWRVLKPGGVFVLSDAQQGSAVALFLDGFVAAHNSTGHEGLYLDRLQTPQDLRDVGFEGVSGEPVDYHWRADSLEQLVDFCACLFDVRKATAPAMRAALSNELGIDYFQNGQVGLRWSLLTCVATKPTEARA
jgi:SAM-dependent methyltransferase